LLACVKYKLNLKWRVTIFREGTLNLELYWGLYFFFFKSIIFILYLVKQMCVLILRERKKTETYLDFCEGYCLIKIMIAILRISNLSSTYIMISRKSRWQFFLSVICLHMSLVISRYRDYIEQYIIKIGLSIRLD